MLGGSIFYETTLPFTGTEPDDPDAGQLVLTGAEGASIVLNAIDIVNVEILVDADGDGTTDVTIQTTWDVMKNARP